MFLLQKRSTVIAVGRGRCVAVLGLLGIRHHKFTNIPIKKEDR